MILERGTRNAGSGTQNQHFRTQRQNAECLRSGKRNSCSERARNALSERRARRRQRSPPTNSRTQRQTLIARLTQNSRTHCKMRRTHSTVPGSIWKPPERRPECSRSARGTTRTHYQNALSNISRTHYQNAAGMREGRPECTQNANPNSLQKNTT